MVIRYALRRVVHSDHLTSRMGHHRFRDGPPWYSALPELQPVRLQPGLHVVGLTVA